MLSSDMSPQQDPRVHLWPQPRIPTGCRVAQQKEQKPLVDTN